MTDPLVLAKLAIAMADAGRKEVRRSEHQAVVLRTDGDGTCWVRIPGGADETPIRTRLVEAMPGDVVNVTISNGRATINGNVTSPTATTRSTQTALQTAVDASVSAEAAMGSAQMAKEAADSAIYSAQTAADAAASAQMSADEAQREATSASRSASDALTSLSTVESVVDTLTWISEHGTYVPTEDSSVAEGKTYYVAGEAYTKTADVEPQQGKTYYTATSTTEQVESYVASADTVVDSGKTYYVISEGAFVEVSDPAGNPSESGYYELVVTTTTIVDYTAVQSPQAQDMGSYYEQYVTYSPVEDPSPSGLSGYYELQIDAALTSYVSSHVSLTDDGLWLTLDDASYRLLLSADGVRVVDTQGHAVSVFGEDVYFDSTRPQRIGGDDAYVEWYDSDNDSVADALRIVVSSIQLVDGGTSTGIATTQDVSDAQQEVSTQVAAVQHDVNDVAAEVETISGYVRITTGSNPALELGSEDAQTRAVLDGSKLDFTVVGDELPVASIGIGSDDAGQLEVTRATFSESLSMGNWQWTPRANGNLALKRIGA